MDEKLKLIKYLNYLLSNLKYRINLLNIIDSNKNKHLMFNKDIVNSIFIIILLKNILAFYVKNRYISRIIADFSYNWNFSTQWRLFEITVFIFTILVELLSYFNHNNKKILKIIAIELQTNKFDIPINAFKCIQNY